ncbi:orotate phosphoribosyltransferase [Candidatus Aerophobetes bacterium]|uniref:Orotate phosphoribosyltransferase n=1 Tax=Aerophobetes bacterium TaxID=2030807 RepID=A0A662D4H3_UNCAE|nr:MAG: orotate phosphoribosyltransferase [Candidatus Aerophobetes bacterium]
MSLKEEKNSLLQLIKEKALFCQPVKLSSSKKSSYYVDGRQITLSAKGAYLVAKLIFPMIKDDNIQAIGGPTLGADPILGAVICWSHLENFPLEGFIVRKEPKKHGMQRYIEGPALKKGTRVAIIDDVVTTGESVLRSARAVEELGCRVVRIICLVDRLEGAGERLKKYGYKLTPLFTRNDLELLE